MPKLDYTLSEEDGALLQTMRKSRDPVMVVITLEINETIAKIDKAIAAKDLPEGQTTVDLLRSMLCEEDQYANLPCIVIFDYVCVNKRSGASTDKVLVFKWIPDTCSKIRDKMVYSSAWEGFKTMLNSTANIQTANMFEAQDYDSVEDRLKEC
ncbi:hypothetical protein ACHWQZ_G000713 [Mnemiopsis leidyi]